MPLKQVGKICREHGLFFIVDSAQTAGVFPIDMQDMHIDALAFTGHKGLSGPQGIGGFLVGSALAAQLEPLIAGGTGSFSQLETMNLLCYPSCLAQETVQAILAGGYDKVKEAGAVIAGGHTIQDSEPKYGLCVSGFIDPKKILKNNGAKAGDILILTKALGTGILTTAAKALLTDEETFSAAAQSMATLNKLAAETASAFHINACTDITGFGLLGHANEMASSSNLTAHIFSQEIGILPKAAEFADMGIIPAGAYANSDYLKDKVVFRESVRRVTRDLLFDPQTSGGLLFSVPKKDADELLARLMQCTPCARIIGEMTEQEQTSLVVE